MALALPATAVTSTSAVNSTMFSIMLRCARRARPAKPVSAAMPSRLPASVSRPTSRLAAAAAISTCTKASSADNSRYLRSMLICVSLPLLGAEQAVACVAKSGNNIPVIVEFRIDRCREHRHVGMDLGEGARALFGAQDADELDALGARLLQTIHSRDRRMRRRQHRIAHQHVAVADVLRDLEVVLDRLQRARIAVQPDMAHAGERHQVEQSLGKPQPGAQN